MLLFPVRERNQDFPVILELGCLDLERQTALLHFVLLALTIGHIYARANGNWFQAIRYLTGLPLRCLC